MKNKLKDYRQEVINAYYEGLTSPQIAKKYNLHYSSVRVFINDNLANIYDTQVPWLLNSKHYPPGSKERRECREINYSLAQLKAIEILGG